MTTNFSEKMDNFFARCTGTCKECPSSKEKICYLMENPCFVPRYKNLDLGTFSIYLGGEVVKKDYFRVFLRNGRCIVTLNKSLS